MAKTWIAFFRGINVGGNNLLPMKSLVSLIEAVGGKEVRTYIQSGNAVFRHNERNAGKLARRIASAVFKVHGFSPNVLLLTREELENAANGIPFPQAVSEPKSLHLAFLATGPTHANFEGLNAIKHKSESFALVGNVFYLYTPEGFGQSKLAGRFEKFLGFAATARNWNTVTKVMALSNDSDKSHLTS